MPLPVWVLLVRSSGPWCSAQAPGWPEAGVSGLVFVVKLRLSTFLSLVHGLEVDRAAASTICRGR